MADREGKIYALGYVLGVIESAAPSAVTPKIYGDFISYPTRWLGAIVKNYIEAGENGRKYDRALIDAMANVDAEELIGGLSPEEQAALIIGEYHAKRDMAKAEAAEITA